MGEAARSSAGSSAGELREAWTRSFLKLRRELASFAPRPKAPGISTIIRGVLRRCAAPLQSIRLARRRVLRERIRSDATADQFRLRPVGLPKLAQNLGTSGACCGTAPKTFASKRWELLATFPGANQNANGPAKTPAIIDYLRVRAEDAARVEAEGWSFCAGWFRACWGRWAWYSREVANG